MTSSARRHRLSWENPTGRARSATGEILTPRLPPRQKGGYEVALGQSTVALGRDYPVPAAPAGAGAAGRQAVTRRPWPCREALRGRESQSAWSAAPGFGKRGAESALEEAVQRLLRVPDVGDHEAVVGYRTRDARSGPPVRHRPRECRESRSARSYCSTVPPGTSINIKTAIAPPGRSARARMLAHGRGAVERFGHRDTGPTGVRNLGVAAPAALKKMHTKSSPLGGHRNMRFEPMMNKMTRPRNEGIRVGAR